VRRGEQEEEEEEEMEKVKEKEMAVDWGQGVSGRDYVAGALVGLGTCSPSSSPAHALSSTYARERPGRGEVRERPGSEVSEEAGGRERGGGEGPGPHLEHTA